MLHFHKSFTLTALSAALAMAVLSPASAQSQTVAAAAKPAAVKPAFPALRLDKMSNGASAIAKLGSNLPAVAAFYGKTPDELVQQLRNDRSAWVDQSGGMFYVEPAMTTAVTNLPPSDAIYPLAQTFALHSRPGSKRKIYLDFNGHTTTSTQWNTNYGVGTIVSAPYDMDGAPGTFSDVELTKIQNVWRLVAEDYAPFDVDVTTEEPPVDLLVRIPYMFNDDTYGMRVVVTPSDFTAPTASSCGGCLGIAFVGHFDEIGSAHKPAFIFGQATHHEKDLATTISHEVGHTLGLSHDGTSTSAYFRGLDTPYGGWGPIMGSPYNPAVSQFSRGEYPDASNKEDDFAVMRSNGLNVVGDDFGNTTATARALAGTIVNGTSTYDARGLIETPADVDFFKFSASPGMVTITAAPYELAPNLDVLVEVRNASGALIAQSNPYESYSAAMSFSIPAAGTYYVSIQGVGDQGPVYHKTDYGSLGRYALRVTAPLTASPPICVARISSMRGVDFNIITFSGGGSSDVSGPIQSYQWNYGDGTANGSGISSTHMFYETGSYVTTLTVTNSSGMSSSCHIAHDVEVLSQ